MTSTARRAPLVVVLIGIAACSRAAYTGRVQGHSDVDAEDRALTARAVAEYRRRQRPSSDAAATARLAHVARALVVAAEAGPAGARAKQVSWEIVLVESPNNTVATFPDGTIFVETGLLRVLPTDDALAGVIGQAVARILLAHGGEVSSHRTTGREMLTLYGIGTGRSRGDVAARQTEEADYVGLVLAVDAGYDPDRAVVLFDQLGLRDRGRVARERLPELRAQHASRETIRPE